ncbi:MAG: TIGR04282 family arsenosugar biosynthesis glycosyltransferase [Actinomycetota bacterium]
MTAEPDEPGKPPVVVVMAKKPVPGRTKTRLHTRLSAQQAAEVYEHLLLDTIEVARRVEGAEVAVAVDPPESVAYFRRLAPGTRPIPQAGADLGLRLDHVLGLLLDEGHPAVAAIGSDSPTIDPAVIGDALAAVMADDGPDLVFGPAADGGYYLIATGERPGPVVTGVVMSTPTVLADTLAVAKRAGRTVDLVATGYDIDEPADLDRLFAELAEAPPETAHHTRTVLGRLDAAGLIVAARAPTPPSTPAATSEATSDGPENGAAADGGEVAVVIPARNEADNIAEVVRRTRATGYRPVIVADNGSDDGTAEAARAAGAVVVAEARPGYGFACAAGVAEAVRRRAAVIAFVDGDLSSPPEELPAVVEPVRAGQAQLAQGSRVAGEIAPGAMALHQRAGNAFAAWLLRTLYPVTVTDLGPFRAIEADLLQSLHMSEMTYGWPTEMTVKAANRGATITEAPVSWLPRAAGRSKVSGTLRGSVLAGRYIVGVTLRHSHPMRAVGRLLRRRRRDRRR